MILLNPTQLNRYYPDERSKEIMHRVSTKTFLYSNIWVLTIHAILKKYCLSI